jgi:hypothetical protein
MNELEQELAGLPRRLRVAFAAGCAQRVLSLYRYTAQGGVVHPGPGAAIETAWSFAAGEDVNAKRIQGVKDEVNGAFPEPDLGGGSDHFAVAAAAYALDAIEDRTPRSALLAAGRVLDAIAQVDEEDGVEEEEAWQRGALQVVKKWGERPIRRDLFGALGGEKPRWLLRFE